MKSLRNVAIFLAAAALPGCRRDAGGLPSRDGGETAAARAVEVVPTSRSTAPDEVFHKAFWQRPTVDDRILHAERREWVDEGGLQKWQWFLVVDASPALLKRLREDNVFGLRAVGEAPAWRNAPEWFRIPPSGVEFMTSATGAFCLILEPTGRRIYATDSGNGFRPGAVDAVPDSSSRDSAPSQAGGRLPDSMPPHPTQLPR